MSVELMKILRKRPVVLDGAMGTTIQAKGVDCSCNEELCLSNPDIIRAIHLDYLKAGSDVILTNTFGASRISLEDHGLANRAREINLRAARIAKEAVESVRRRGFVAGDIGPTSKLPTLSHTTFDALFEAYSEQVDAFLEGGVDLILIETCQDPLQIKAAMSASRHCMERHGKEIPILVSVTMEKIGTMLLGTELDAAMAVVVPFKPSAFGINCATGPEDMKEHLAHLSADSPYPIICEPNAGIPDIADGKASYGMDAKRFGEILAEYAERFSLSFVGGCCGTTPEHISALVEKLKGSNARPAAAASKIRPSAASLYSAVPFEQEPRPFLVAEQTNVNGSKRFRDLLKSNDFEAMAEVARKAAASGHALDICLATPGRDEDVDYIELIKSIRLKVDSPVMVDSTELHAIEAALKLIPGRAIINSINLEDGGRKASRILNIARKYGAAVVGLTIDEDGMAKRRDRKIKIAKRLVELVESEGLTKDDLFVDFLTFTLASGDRGLFDAGVETLAAIAESKREIPGIRTILGVSNISYGLPAKGRKILTSVFLSCALRKGLDAAIINPEKIMPLDKIPDEMIDICMRLIENDRKRRDPLKEFISSVSEIERPNIFAVSTGRTANAPDQALRMSILEGNREDLPSIIDDVLASNVLPLDIINKILLPAMQEVGKSFGDGSLPLPFVLGSAETMRAAIKLVTPHMKVGEAVNRGTIVLATVRGDVHDIGKNLVDAILSNNGFEVINLGIRQPAKSIVETALANRADAIGLSGLLVSSTEIMRQDLHEFRERGLAMPVLCGGAALTPSFVKEVLCPAYGSTVSYCRDAFDGLRVMEEIANRNC